MKISHGIEYAAVRVLAGLFRALPHRQAVVLGECFGRAADVVWAARHRVILKNLEIAFGDSLSENQRRELAREVFGNLGKTLAEVSRFPKINRDLILRMVESEGEDAFREALDYGRGAVLTGSHFGNWELSGAYVNALGYPVDFVVRGQHNPLVDRYLTYLRRCLNVRVIHSERGMREVIRALRDNRQVAIISDQHAGSNGILVEFFGRLVSVPRAPAVLAVKTGAPIITGCIYRRPDDTHYCVFQKPEYPRADADEKEEIFRLTKLFTSRIEAVIRARPDLWLWTHRRFKPVGGAKPTEGSYVE